MKNPVKTVKRSCSFLLLACLLLAGALFPAANAYAAGDGYSDLYEINMILGVNGDLDVAAMSMVYGKPGSSPAGNYALVMKVNVEDEFGALDILDGAAHQALLDNSFYYVQADADDLSDLMLQDGFEDEWLYFYDKPLAVHQIETAVSEGRSVATIEDSIAIMPDALRLAARHGLKLQFDTTDGSRFNSRIIVNPSTATKGIIPIAYSDDEASAAVLRIFQRSYNNTFTSVELFQEGSFGTTVEVVTRPNLSGLNTQSLRFYTYNRFTNKVAEIDAPNYSIDDKGFLHFYTTTGGTVLITDKELSKY